MTKLQEVLDSVQSSPSSIFSKEDVIYLLELANQKTVEEPKQPTKLPPTSEQIIENISKIVKTLIEEAIDNIDTSDILDERNIELGLSGNEIIIEDVDFDMDGLSEKITDYIDYMLEDKLIDSGYFGNEEV